MKRFDLEERTFNYAKAVLLFCKELPKEIINMRLAPQLIDASTSVGANYREANESLSKRGFVHRVKIARKECKESQYWLELLNNANETQRKKCEDLIQEARELRAILSKIIMNSE